MHPTRRTRRRRDPDRASTLARFIVAKAAHAWHDETPYTRGGTMAEPTIELQSFLVRTPFFGGLSEATLARVIQMLRLRELARGATVFEEGESGRSMYIIAAGEVLMTRQGESGVRVHLFRLGVGDFFGETTLIEMHPRPYTARVEAPARLFELSNMDLYRLYREDVAGYVMVLQNINRELCRRLRSSDHRIAEIADAFGDERTQIHPTKPGTSLPPHDR
jgi:CRP-like cAMP-binding protein